MARVNEQAWIDLEEEREHLQPTPPVGEDIVWYVQGNKQHPVAAKVTGIEGPGRISVVAWKKNAFHNHQGGVYHVSAKIHTKPGNPTTQRCGSWDYVRGQVPDEDYDLHRKELDKREANLAKGEQDAQKNAEIFAQKKAENKALSKKPRPPDPLPTPTF